MKLSSLLSIQNCRCFASSQAAPGKKSVSKSLSTLKSTTKKGTSSIDLKASSRVFEGKMPEPAPVVKPTGVPSFKLPELALIDYGKDKSESFASISPSFIAGIGGMRRLPASIFEHSNLFSNCKSLDFLVRTNYLARILANTHLNKTIIDGQNGIGKSALLLQVASSWWNSSKNDKKLMLFIPRVSEFIMGNFPYYPITPASGEQKENPNPTILYDMPEAASELLKSFLKLNEKSVILSAPLLSAEKDRFSNLKELISKGMENSVPLPVGTPGCSQSQSLLIKMFQILNDPIQYFGFKINFFVGMDEVNTLFLTASGYTNPNGSPAEIDQFPLLVALKTLLVTGSHVTCVCSKSYSDGRYYHNYMEKFMESHSDSIQRVSLEPLHKSETSKILEFYEKIGLTEKHTDFHSKSLSLDKKHLISGGVPGLLFKVARYEELYE